ncbi:MAG: DNA topoisomerase 3 [Nitrospinota bacterium]|nr:DNA topoisomerase 3 [Nitrospinota bacterium]
MSSKTGAMLILCEKPSQARDIAAGLGINFTKRDGYLEGTGYVVTWAFGHLVELEDAEFYDKRYSKWDIGTLPILPEEFKYRINKKGASQFKTVKKLINSTVTGKIVICTDPGREGELIARLILKLSGNKKPLYRFWTSKALTPATVMEGFSMLRSASEFDRLYLSAMLRQQADWLIGINATRAFTVHFGELYSLGRVQTPTLRIIVDRELEIRDFKPIPYWLIKAEFKHVNGRYEGSWIPSPDKSKREEDNETGDNQEISSRIFDEKQANAISNSIDGKPGTIVSISREPKTERPPLLFSLTDLQREANIRFGVSAKETLDIAQALYEKYKAISYPRTESRHLNEELVPEIGHLLKVLSGNVSVKFDLSKTSVTAKNKNVFDSNKLTDHHALIPTLNIPDARRLSDNELNIYTLIVARFLAAFHPPYKYLSTKVITKAANEFFVSTGKKITDIGWKDVYGNIEKDKILPDMNEKDPVATDSTSIDEKETTPPSRYTDASLLSAMMNAQKFVTDAAHKKILKSTSGLGTPATRAAIIESLIAREYVKKSGKVFTPTDKGIFLISKVREEKISDPAYTAIWEEELEAIASGSAEGKTDFLKGIKNYATEMVEKVRGLSLPPGQKANGHDRKSAGTCPECGQPVHEGKINYFCSTGKDKCKFTLFKNCLAGLGKSSITSRQVSDLLKGKTIKLAGLQSKKSRRTFSAEGKLSKSEKYGWQVELIFEKAKSA